MSLIEQLVVDTIEEYERLAGEYSCKAEALRAEWAALNRPVDPSVDQSVDADGWIKWYGGDCPVANGPLVEVCFRDGGVLGDQWPEGWSWSHDGSSDDIVAYRVVSWPSSVSLAKKH